MGESDIATGVTLRQVLAHRAGLRFEPDGLAQVFSELVRPLRARLGTLPQQRLEIARQALATFSRGQCWNSSPVGRGKS